MPRHRVVLSRILNVITRTLFGLPLADVSSGYRLYRADFIKRFQLRGRHFDILIELLVKAERGGGRFAEVPFHYCNRESGVSKARILSFGMAYLRTLVQLRAGL